MKFGEITVEVKIKNKEKLSRITDNILNLAELAKNKSKAGDIASLIIKDLKGLFVPSIKSPRDNQHKH